MSAGLRVDLIVKPRAVSWRMWSSSRIVAASSEGYVKRSAAIGNLETVTGGVFETCTPESPTPYGVLRRREAETRSGPGSEYVHTVEIPVRLVGP